MFPLIWQNRSLEWSSNITSHSPKVVLMEERPATDILIGWQPCSDGSFLDYRSPIWWNSPFFWGLNPSSWFIDDISMVNGTITMVYRWYPLVLGLKPCWDEAWLGVQDANRGRELRRWDWWSKGRSKITDSLVICKWSNMMLVQYVVYLIYPHLNLGYWGENQKQWDHEQGIGRLTS